MPPPLYCIYDTDEAAHGGSAEYEKVLISTACDLDGPLTCGKYCSCMCLPTGVAGSDGMFVVYYVPEARTCPSLIPAIVTPRSLHE